MSRWQTHCLYSHQGKQRPTSPTSHSHNNVNIPEVRVVRKSDTPIPPAPKVALNKTTRSKKQRPKAREERKWANEKIKYFSHQKMPIKDSLPRESLRVPLATTRSRSLASIESSISGHALTMSAGPPSSSFVVIVVVVVVVVVEKPSILPEKDLRKNMYNPTPPQRAKLFVEPWPKIQHSAKSTNKAATLPSWGISSRVFFFADESCKK